MATTGEIDDAWLALGVPWQTAIDRAVESFGARGLPVGAAITHGSSIVSVGRNRVYDPAGGSDPLQRTPLAHAEMNAIASVPDGTDLEECELWTTHSPCAMCAAAATFVAVSTVRHLAADPSDPDAPIDATDRDVWSTALNLMFLHNVAWVGGVDNPIIVTNTDRRPRLTEFALALVSDETLITNLPASNATDLLRPIWRDVVGLSSISSR